MKYDQESVTAYLLGAASDSDIERFDELSVADDEFVDAINIAEDELIDTYISGELTGQTLERFNSYYMATPMRRQRVEFAKAFRQFAEGHSRVPAVQQKTAENAGRHESLISRLWRFPALNWGFAAVAVLFAGVAGWLALQNIELRRQADEAASVRNAAAEREVEFRRQLDNQNRDAMQVEPEIAGAPEVAIPPPSVEKQPERPVNQNDRRQHTEAPAAPRVQIATFILTPPVRSGSKLSEFAVPPTTGRAIFQIKMEPNDFKTHQVELIERSSGRAIWKSGRLRPSGDTVSVNIPANLLNSGIYSFQVTGMSGSGDSERIGDYYFRIAK